MEVHACGGLLHISRVTKANCHPNATITDNYALLSLRAKGASSSGSAGTRRDE